MIYVQDSALAETVGYTVQGPQHPQQPGYVHFLPQRRRHIWYTRGPTYPSFTKPLPLTPSEPLH